MLLAAGVRSWSFSRALPTGGIQQQLSLRGCAPRLLALTSAAPPQPISATLRRHYGVQEFWDGTTKPEDFRKVGRAWRASELRLKSFDDLHKLWFVLLKERNMLVTQRKLPAEDEKGKLPFKNTAKSRLRKVRDSMARLLTVLTERRLAEEREAMQKQIDEAAALGQPMPPAARRELHRLKTHRRRRKHSHWEPLPMAMAQQLRVDRQAKLQSKQKKEPKALAATTEATTPAAPESFIPKPAASTPPSKEGGKTEGGAGPAAPPPAPKKATGVDLPKPPVLKPETVTSRPSKR
jgi:large subunit ribosomal protein L47